MAQFDVYRNSNAATRSRIPYLLDIQSDLLNSLATRVVVPLCKSSLLKGKLAERLNPVVQVEGIELALLTPELAGVSGKILGSPISNLASERLAIVAALDLLIAGI